MSFNPPHQDWTPIVFHNPKQKPQKIVRTNGIDDYERKLDQNNDIVKPKKMNQNMRKAIQSARLNNKMSQKDLASRLNVPLQTIAMYESGKAIPNNSLIVKIEQVLKTKIPRK